MKSPAPPKKSKKDLTFSEALTEIMEGNSVTKKEWDNKEVHCLLRFGHLTIHKEDDKYYDWILSDGDMYGEDYYVL